MKLSKIYAELDAVAPKRLSDEYCQKYGAYDNSGVLVDTGEEIDKVLFTLDLTTAAVQEAKSIGAKLIVTHHPVIYGGKTSFTQASPMDKNLLACMRLGISIVSMHLNLDTAQDGIDENLALAVKKAAKKVGKSKSVKTATALMHPLSEGGYGRAYAVSACKLHELASSLQEELACARVHVYGAKEEVKKAVSCCGAGVDESSIAFAIEQGADVLISSDFKHHLIVSALENGVSVIAPTHYATENYGFRKYYEKISKALSIPCVLHEDKQLL